ncbi:MAG: phosphoribosylglycinamide formyltransferase [Deltaproteobacteria bacterium]|jgi:phosphoribosylglycinamide formyltransferase-1|nr:phosphoribosylglycinamide formyltransferase [Deltaproteobacteria bacterium]
MRVGVLCSGRGSNLRAILEARGRGEIPGAEFVCIVSDVAGAGCLDIAGAHGVASAVVPSRDFRGDRPGFERRLLETLASFGAELTVLAGFQRVLGKAFLGGFPGRVMNIHPALLPSFPGHEVWGRETAHGVKLAGATVHFVDEGVDSGPIICQGAVPVLDTDDADALSARILTVEHRIYPAAVAWVTSGRVRLQGRRVALDGFAPSGEAAAARLVWPPLDA